jgi:hypothetical protein
VSDSLEPPRRSAIALGLAGALVIVALWEIVWTRVAASGVPDDGDWERAAAHVRANHRPGDLIVFAPDWIDPVGRLHLGDLIPVAMAARMDAERYGRIWELSIRDARSRDTAGLTPAEAREVGGVTVRRFERPPATILADVRELLPRAKIDGQALSPPAVVLAEVGFAPHRCIQVTPMPGRPVRITFALPAGTLVGYAGLADVFTRRNIRTPGKVEVEAGGKVIASVTPGIDDGWVRFAAPLTEPGDVTFSVKATALERLICFAAEVRP